jgi:alanine racemase
MATGILTIDLDALARNWRSLDRASAAQTETGAVVKADAYGLGAGRVARRLAQEGARRFFVAVAQEGAALRQALGPGPEILVLGGHMRGDTDMIADLDLVPMLNSIDQLTRHFEALPGRAFGLQLDTGMNRLGLEPAEWAAVREIALPRGPRLVMSHLACADEPEHPMNAAQLALFRELTDGIEAPRSLSATGGILLGDAYHFDLTRPGVGLYGGEPFLEADPVAWLSVPVIQIREVQEGETVGYGSSWTASRDVKLATIAAGYADGLIRAAGQGGALAFSRGQACAIVGRISMDLITVDVSGLDHEPDSLDLLCAEQTVDDFAAAAGTIGYEVLTSLGGRYHRRYRETGA